MDYDPTEDALYHPELRPTLFSSSPGWTPTAICAELSRLAYIRVETGETEQRTLKSALDVAGLGTAHPFHSLETGARGFGVTSIDGKHAYLVFRGTQTDDLKDFYSDANAVLRRLTNGTAVHSGFADALDSVWHEVAVWLAANATVPVLSITGHSLGAALATLAATREECVHARLITFGSPRVGDGLFARSFDGRTVERYVDCCDLVTLVPTEYMGYVHVSAMHYIDRKGALFTPEKIGKAAIGKDRLTARIRYLLAEFWVRRNARFRSLADHAPVNYVRVFVQAARMGHE